MDGWSLVFQVAEIVRFLTDCAIRIAVVVAGLLSVPGLRHVGAQGLLEICLYGNTIMRVNLP